MRPLLLWPALLPALVLAGGFQPVDSLRAAALATVPDREAPGVQAEAAVDGALRLPACPQALAAHAAPGGVAEVACPAAGWRLYIPVRVRRVAPVVVLARAVSAGEPITPEVLRVEQRDTGLLAAGSFADPTAVHGRVARRSLGAGSVLAPADVAAPRLLRRGDSVMLVVRQGAVEVRMAGRALADAGPEERVSVENIASHRVVQGVLRASGEVEVP